MELVAFIEPPPCNGSFTLSIPQKCSCTNDISRMAFGIEKNCTLKAAKYDML
jgi:hypothetical protein